MDLDAVVVVDGDVNVAGRFVAHSHVQVAVHIFVHARVSGFAHEALTRCLRNLTRA